jgi:hypothetical protein
MTYLPINRHHIDLLIGSCLKDTKGVIKIEGQTTQWAKKNGQTAIDKRINRKLKIA